MHWSWWEPFGFKFCWLMVISKSLLCNILFILYLLQTHHNWKNKIYFCKCWINSILYSFSRICGVSFFLKSFHIQITFYTQIWPQVISWPFVFINWQKIFIILSSMIQSTRTWEKSTREEILIKKWIINSYERILFFPSSGDVYQGWKVFWL